MVDWRFSANPNLDPSISHNNIRPQNIFIDRDGKFILGNPGYAISWADKPEENFLKPDEMLDVVRKLKSKDAILSPEVKNSRLNDFTCQSDIWMFGYTLYEIVTGVKWKPNYDDNGVAILDSTLFSNYPNVIEKLIRRCLHLRASERPLAEDLFKSLHGPFRLVKKLKSKPYNVFIVYARKDAGYLEELLSHLRPMERAGMLKIWCDREIDPGVKWEEAILRNMDTTDIILLMVSAAYYDSSYIHDKELKYALMRHENGEATVIPVIVRPCNFKVDPIVSSLQVLPKNARPVTSWNDRDDAWMNVVDGINRVLEKMASPDLDALRNAEELEQQQKEKGIAAKRAKPERKIRKEEELGRDAINQKDDYAWEVTLKKGTKAGYQKYLKKYPTGLHADEAKVHMKELNSTVSGKDSTLDMWVTAKSISDIHSESNNTILWVDDRPSNNIYEREALELVGFKFELALSTKEALTLLEKNKYLAIISDMGRVEGPREGYILLKEVRKTDKKIPFFIYAGSNLLEHKIEAQEKGAQGSTNSATELIDLITTHVQPKIG